jgi:hypothetical protein
MIPQMWHLIGWVLWAKEAASRFCWPSNSLFPSFSFFPKAQIRAFYEVLCSKNVLPKEFSDLRPLAWPLTKQRLAHKKRWPNIGHFTQRENNHLFLWPVTWRLSPHSRTTFVLLPLLTYLWSSPLWRPQALILFCHLLPLEASSSYFFL